MIDSTVHLKLEKYEPEEIDGKVFVEPKEIEYKPVDPKVFSDAGYKVFKTELSCNEDGFLTEAIVKAINLGLPSTDILNVATGTGKTTAIHQLVKKILDTDSRAIVIMATPFISLVDKDRESLIGKYSIDIQSITDYNYLQKDFDTLSSAGMLSHHLESTYIKDKRIHILTINALLRNPGETAFDQKFIKTDYLNLLIAYCKKRDYKVYLIIDEIHASIHNFKNELIHYLTMWKTVIHKVIISTATFTEPVYIAAKHLAYSTNDVVNIYESKRIKNKEISQADILFYPEKYKKSDLSTLCEFLQNWIERNKTENSKYHILCYSKSLSEGLKTHSYFDEAILVTSSTKAKFNDMNNNIGTNFGTGIGIEEVGHLYIVIFPCKYSEYTVKGEDGIFNDGLPSILQSVARLRKKGRILFVIPPLKKIIDTTKSRDLIKIIGIPEDIKFKVNKTEPVEFFIKEDFISDEVVKLNKRLKRNKEKVEKELAYYEEHKGNSVKRPEIQFPSPSTFILNRGQEYIKSVNFKSGKYITPYIIWAALHDQFINCSLDKIFYLRRISKVLSFSKDNYVENFIEYYNRYKKEDTPPDNFYDYFDFINALLKTVNKNGKNYSVTIKDNNKKISRKAFIKRIDVYIALIKSYFLIKGIKVTDPLDGLTDYLIFASKNISIIDDKINDQITYLSKICKEFETEFKGKKVQTNEISNSGFFDDVKIDLLRESILFIQDKDPVISTAKRIQIKYCHKKSKDALIAFFIENFIKRGKPDGKGRREVIATYL